MKTVFYLGESPCRSLGESKIVFTGSLQVRKVWQGVSTKSWFPRKFGLEGVEKSRITDYLFS